MLNRDGLARKFAAKTYNTIEKSESLIKAFEETIVDILLEGESINLQSFGKFETKVILEHEGKNPQDQSPLMIPKKVYPKFKFSEKVKNFLSNN